MYQQRTVNKDALRHLVEHGGAPFRQNVRSWRIYCPLCGQQKLYVEKTTGRCRCMHCGGAMSGWADHVLSQVYPHSKKELEVLLYGGVDIGIFEHQVTDLADWWGEFEDTEEIEIETTVDIPPIIWDPDVVDLDKPAGAKGLAYLESRGIPLAIAQKYGVRYNARERRVCFPVVVDGVMRGWQARLISPNEFFNEEGRKVILPKILTTGAVGGHVLMFQDNLKGSEHGILVEGPVDAIKADLCGGNCATMGKSFTKEQADIYIRSGIKKLYVGLDDDAAERIMRVARELSPYLDLYRLATPKGREDLGDSTFEEVYEEFKTAKPLNPAHVFVYLDSRPPGMPWGL